MLKTALFLINQRRTGIVWFIVLSFLQAYDTRAPTEAPSLTARPNAVSECIICTCPPLIEARFPLNQNENLLTETPFT